MDDPKVLLCLSVISAAVAVMALALAIGAWELRRTLRRVNALLPDFRQAARELRQTARSARRVAVGVDRAVHDVRQVVHEGCEVVSSGVAELSLIQERAKALFGEHLGNGARGGPRRRYRG